jgi:hypothetical protein
MQASAKLLKDHPVVTVVSEVGKANACPWRGPWAIEAYVGHLHQAPHRHMG